MKIKKYFVLLSIIIVVIPLAIFIFLNIKFKININKNEDVINKYDNIFKQIKIDTHENLILSKLQIENVDYVGIINIKKHNIRVPVQSDCKNKGFNIQPACNYSNKNFMIMATSFKDSFYQYDKFDVDDIIEFDSMSGNKYEYKIKNIKRTNKLDLTQYNEDFILVIKNFYNLEYVLIICEQ